MPQTVILTAGAPAPGGPYSQAIASSNILAISGQVGINPATGEAPAGVIAQARQALANLEAILAAAGAKKRDVVKTTCFLTDINDFPIFNEEYKAFFGDHRPARSTFGVQLFGGYVVEIEALAVLSNC